MFLLRKLHYIKKDKCYEIAALVSKDVADLKTSFKLQ